MKRNSKLCFKKKKKNKPHVLKHKKPKAGLHACYLLINMRLEILVFQSMSSKACKSSIFWAVKRRIREERKSKKPVQIKKCSSSWT